MVTLRNLSYLPRYIFHFSFSLPLLLLDPVLSLILVMVSCMCSGLSPVTRQKIVMGMVMSDALDG